MSQIKYKRILLKLSGEALAGEQHRGLDYSVIHPVCEAIKQCHELGVQIGLNEGKVVIFAAGTGNPYFSTDTGAVLRGVEIEADAILMAKNVDGIYSADPNVDPTAVKFDELTYDEVLARHLKATDTTAMTLAMDNHMTLVCFALADPNNILRVVSGEKIGTIVKEDNK